MFSQFFGGKRAIMFDERWIGDHGIGRFAREIWSRWPDLPAAGLGGRPSDSLDCLRTAAWLVRHPRTILFTPGYNAPLVCQSRCILGVHDLNHIDAPGNQGLLKRLYYRLVLQRACRRAARVLTVSEYSRRRIVEWSGAEPGRVINVGNGVSAVFRADPSHEQSSSTPYFLSVSNRKPHKNESRLLEAFRAADLPAEVRLLITGDATPEQQAWLARHGLNERIGFLGSVSDETLADHYRGAWALLFVSLYEGFGLPAVEAMACGTPVIASDVTSLPEVIGDAGLLIDPEDTGAITMAIERLWRNPGLRDILSRDGIRRARRFDWNEVSDRVHRAMAGFQRSVRP